MTKVRLGLIGDTPIICNKNFRNHKNLWMSKLLFTVKGNKAVRAVQLSSQPLLFL